jgi:hypothetical protein
MSELFMIRFLNHVKAYVIKESHLSLFPIKTYVLYESVG